MAWSPDIEQAVYTPTLETTASLGIPVFAEAVAVQ
jgi:hypothetical protein